MGNLEQGAWGLRVGRQELSYGDERLIGTDSLWSPFGLSFDAVRLSVGTGRVRMDGFAALPVATACGKLDRITADQQLYGLYARITHRGSGALEPYFLWRHSRQALDEWDGLGTRDIQTYGVRSAGKLPRNLDYNLETAIQRGHVVGDHVGAWAGHWELGYRFGHNDLAPRLAVEYNYATGDASPGDRRHGTFDHLYQAGFSKYGTADPLVWRNLRNLASGLDWKLNRRWTLSGGFRALWLASVADGLYTGGDDFMVRNPMASSAHIGNEFSLAAGYQPSGLWRLHAGYSRILPGAFLKESTYDGALSGLHLTWVARF